MTARPPETDASLGDLLAVDMSLTSPGAALFRGGRLIAATRVKLDEDIASLPGGMREQRVAEEVVRWAAGAGARPRWLVCERPKVYHGRKAGKVDPDDLLRIALACGVLQGILAMGAARHDEALETTMVIPSDWIGQIPKITSAGKALASPRGRLIWNALRDDERRVLPIQHDAFDGVGLGLWRLHRLFPPAVYEGCTEDGPVPPTPRRGGLSLVR